MAKETFDQDGAPGEHAGHREPEPAGAPSILEATRRLTRDVAELGHALDVSRARLAVSSARFVREQPLAAAGLVFGVGYVVGGGLFSSTTRRVLKIGWRLGGVALARRLAKRFGIGAAPVPAPKVPHAAAKAPRTDG
jgi:hypothetical protein